LTGGSTPRYPTSTTSTSTSGTGTTGTGKDPTLSPQKQKQQHHHHHHHHHMTIVLSMKYLNAIFPLDDGQRVCCMAGVGLATVRIYIYMYGDILLTLLLFPNCSGYCVCVESMGHVCLLFRYLYFPMFDFYDSN
jgi:hypothetical protein